MRTIKEIILHCSATAEGKDFKAKDIKKWHVEGNKWSDIGYHYVIDLDGTIELGRTVQKTGAHVTGHNTNTIGICYVGGVATDGKTPKDTRTPAQKKSLITLVKILLDTYGLNINNVKCHNQYANKACPSFKIEEFKKEFGSC